MLLALSALLALLPLLWIGSILLQGGPAALLTMDGLFTSLILLAISGTLALNFAFALRKKRQPVGSKSTRPTAAPGTGTMQRGRVENVQFFEANVGLPNKSLVSFSNGNGVRDLVFDGDLRNALPVGRMVEVAFRREFGHNVLLEVNYC